MTLLPLIPRSIMFIFVLCLPVFSAIAQISGKIVDTKTEEPIIGANIIIPDSYVGTTSNEHGNFSLDWFGDFPVKIRVSHIGYGKQEIIVLNPGEVWVGLVPEVLKGEEVIITGERKQIEREVSSSGELVLLKKVEFRGIRDISEVLQEMSSVVISTTPSGRQTVSVRGSNANEVSVYLDGIKINRALDGIADLSAIDITELASVEIIKGGNSVLFGPGNFGGVIHLSSKLPLSNEINIFRSIGLTDERDQDLSGEGTLRLGPFGFGGRFSGKSRLYDGRTLYTTLFENGVSTFNLSSGMLSARYLSLSNSVKFQSGGIMSKDELKVSRFGFRGSILGSKGWEAHYGIRRWEWEDSFFDNIERNLADETTRMQIAKTFHWNYWDGTLQWESEDQSYSGDNYIKERDSNRNWKDNGILRSADKGWASVVRYTAQSGDSTMELVRFELGLRQSTSKYSHNQNILEFDSLTVVKATNYQITSKTNIRTFRLGTFVEGVTSIFKYSLFFNQGWNKRLPTLNDYFLWFTVNNQAELIMQAVSEEEQAILFQGVLTDALLVEHASTTEVGGKLIWDHITVAPINRWEVNASIFRNHYIDKIAYRTIGGFLPIPYNTPIASLNGVEIGTRIKLLRIFKGSAEFSGNITLLSFSNKEVFPNKPNPVTHFTLDWWKEIFHLNISYIYEGPQLLQRAGTDIRQYSSRRNTNLTLSLIKTIWKFDVILSYTVRNLFSNKVTFVDFAHYSTDPFNYYEAHRSLLSIKIVLSEQEKKL